MRYNGKNFKRVMNEAKDSKSIGMFIGIVSEFDPYFTANPDAFCNTNLRSTVFDSCSFSNMKFSDTDFVGCVIMNTVFENCAFSECWFGSGKFINCCFTKCRFEASMGKDSQNFINCSFNITDEELEEDMCKIDSVFPHACPSTGSFIGWKAAYYGAVTRTCIVKLYIPASAKRSSGFGRKCRCSKAKVLGFYDMDGKKLDNNVDAISFHDINFHYTVGKYVMPRHRFNDNRFMECASGIHFFINMEEAKRYLQRR